MTARITALSLIALDVLTSVVVFNLLSYARGVIEPGAFLLVPLLAPVSALLIAIYLVQGYRSRTDMLSVDYASQHAIAVLIAMVATLLLTYVVLPGDIDLQNSRAVIALSFFALMLFTLGYRRLIYLRSLGAHAGRSLVFVGDAQSFGMFQEECRKMDVHRPIICPDSALISARAAPASGSTNAPSLAALLEEIRRGNIEVEAIVLRESAHDLPPSLSQQLVQLYFAGVPTYTLELFHEVYWQKIPLYRLNQTWLFQEGFQIAREPVFERIKRACDIVFSFFALLVSSPVILLSALAIWIEDRGSPLFAQTRIGKNHVPFRIYKLRTMRPTAGGARYTAPGDSRITVVGRWLRLTRIDEFPQLWNVLRGEMSLIGPRAEWDKLVVDYERQIPCYYFRHLVRPGITGWAQVNYPYGASIEDTLRKLEYDLYYIRHFSFRLDATIVLKTIHTMLFGKGQ
ncbi:exopolysaccharide biosynthesis polyprenyl glycosylphosphotransferase [Opitutus sp. ER46]|uniref:exopolysaccharide biosynthesis polyprenyl glycosylphosphotransferase n=1 Tax=Opitutus sp. ER46 TaxID=2161864 RepID=UPI000D32601E|nr:exopolysaccharide biosynthesis polyprenyl glycosylphosphotransferase [Opitutus sp. ER46]PTX91087.1 polyprenyl glycosylphosphotransferase [Opitutus sp. ER46]